jgi:hypothetical protein
MSSKDVELVSAALHGIFDEGITASDATCEEYIEQLRQRTALAKRTLL